MTTTNLIANSDKKLWMAAIKPPMYSVAVVPIWVGSAIANWQTQQWRNLPFFLFLTAAIAIIAWLNLSNDVFDSETGIDKNKAHSVVNLTGNKSLVFWIANLCLGLGISGIIAIAFLQRDVTVLALVLLCCALGYTYQGPPFRLGYLGLGEIICFFSFGPLAIAAAYYSQAQSFSPAFLLASAFVGVSTSIILFCSHFHQVEDDLAAGKRSPIVRLGTALGAKVLAVSVASLFAMVAIGLIIGNFPLWTAIVFITLPIGYELVRHVSENHDRPERVSNCKFIAVKLHFWSGFLLGLGFILPNLYH
ncbi:2-carboxy-1,4-naphthoquinone phytyltransferase [Oscillatoria sp. FACHB-1406]|uniref:2-carboxy-1,4-naphthoquinone phytyltransferase n=1 Tax=Oscillatoria sp. FACHB-1406 TaxID=2692846 RepID=UPI001683B428|nr:2-carboxy-1,4-naphthoquinone phytyltransferase [Oscillatoria sp. FACHB-1406]MBD2576161.1 2-carboxy-1,4-naphthoquinone phytyltransferase [Oscillatoria sp. FACHB-1406]